MVLYPLLNHDDLRRWRVCSRRFWLHRCSLQVAATNTTIPDADAGEGADAALRASYPLADVIPAPSTQAEWTRALKQTLHCLDNDHVAPEGWAILGACLTSGLAACCTPMGAVNNMAFWPMHRTLTPVAPLRCRCGVAWTPKRASNCAPHGSLV